MSLTLDRLRSEAHDLVGVVLFPAIASLLPWKLVFTIFRQLAHLPFLYRESSERALAEAKQRGWVDSDREWIHHRKLTTLVDHADHYLARTRGDHWMNKYLQTTGAWPAIGQPALLLTFHWGAGMWGLRHAARAGMKAHALMAPLDGAHFAGRRILHRYIGARARTVADALRCPFVDISTDMRPVLRALQRNEQVLAVVDVPADQVAASQRVSILDLPARLPTALLRLAVQKSIPVYIYVTGIRTVDGQRFLRIRELGVATDLETLVNDYASALDGLIRENPPAWHFWSEAERFFRG